MKITPYLAILVTLLLSSCSKKPIKVDSFVVLKSGESIKLGLMEVGAVELDTCIIHFEDFLIKRDEKISELSEEKAKHKLRSDKYTASKKLIFKQIDEVAEDAKTEEAQFLRAVNAANRAAVSFNEIGFDEEIKEDREFGYFGNITSTAEGAPTGVFATPLRGNPQKAIDFVNSQKDWEKHLKTYKSSVISTANKYKIKLDLIRSLVKKGKGLRYVSSDFDDEYELQSTKSVARIFENLPDYSVSQKTNADGLCEITMPKRGKWVVFSKFSRTVGDSRENYYWIILHDTSKGESTLTLSNDNMIEEDQIPKFLYK